MKILVLGASGMLGSAIVRVLSESNDMEVFGSTRCAKIKKFFNKNISNRLVNCKDVTNYSNLIDIFNNIKPSVVINCISLNKKFLIKSDPLLVIPIYALLPHQLAKLCKINNSRLIHISTDGIFSGSKGGYVESDSSDVHDLYGISKFIGEVKASHTISIRTSVIGHELKQKKGFLEWFLSQKKSCKCYSKAIFSGFPTVVLAQIIRDIIIPRPDLSGIFHVASNPISKCELMNLIANIYGKKIKIIPDSKISMNRSLNSDRFKNATGYNPPNWESLVKIMHLYQ
jgi:dTDP-4-dehydrorhamnose reductase